MWKQITSDPIVVVTLVVATVTLRLAVKVVKALAGIGSVKSVRLW